VLIGSDALSGEAREVDPCVDQVQAERHIGAKGQGLGDGATEWIDRSQQLRVHQALPLFLGEIGAGRDGEGRGQQLLGGFERPTRCVHGGYQTVRTPLCGYRQGIREKELLGHWASKEVNLA